MLALNTATETAVAFACPASDGATVTENGLQWVIGCGKIVQGTSAGNYPAPNGFNDCFLDCDATSGCTGFTYNGGANGLGAGTCYFRNGATEGFLTNDTNHVGAVRLANYVPLPTTTVSLRSPQTSIDCVLMICVNPDLHDYNSHNDGKLAPSKIVINSTLMGCATADYHEHDTHNNSKLKPFKSSVDRTLTICANLDYHKYDGYDDGKFVLFKSSIDIMLMIGTTPDYHKHNTHNNGESVLSKN